jgi:hypothetical protein
MQRLQKQGRGERSSPTGLPRNLPRMIGSRLSPVTHPVGERDDKFPQCPCQLKYFRCNAYKKQGAPPSDNLSRPGKFHQHHIRVLFHSFENNVAAVRRNVEVANVEISGQLGQLSLDSRLQVHHPEILMLDLSF